MSRAGGRWRAALPYLLLFGAVLVVGGELARPIRSASIAYDSQVSVLYFERILSGHRLEQYVPTNPKPLLTLLFGALYHVTGDWRTLAWVTLLAAATGVTLTARLTTRVAGGAAGAFVGTLLVFNTSLLFDIGFALAVPFALVGWAVAGLAYSAPRPRYAMAGIALALAALARVETLVLVGVITLALAWGTFAPLRWRVTSVPRRAWLVPLLALIALPVMLLHDLRLTGDPLYWLSVAPRYAAQGTARLPTPGEVARGMLEHYWLMGGVVALGVFGFAKVVWDRRWWLAVAIVGLGPAIAAFLVYLAFRKVIVPPRYVAPIDVAAIVAAGVAVGQIAASLPALLPASLAQRFATPRWRFAPAIAAVAVALLLAGPYWVVSPDLRSLVNASRAIGVQSDAARGAMRLALLQEAASGATAKAAAPGSIVPRVAVDLGLTLDRMVGTTRSALDVAGPNPSPGTVVLRSRVWSGASPAWADLKPGVPAVVGGVAVVPYVAEPAAGYWVVGVR